MERIDSKFKNTGKREAERQRKYDIFEKERKRGAYKKFRQKPYQLVYAEKRKAEELK